MTILGVGSAQIHMANNFGETVSRLGTEVSDINGGIHSLYIYCDLLESVPVGDIEAPLLRVVDGRGKHGKMQSRYFEKPRYIPLQKKTLTRWKCW